MFRGTRKALVFADQLLGTKLELAKKARSMEKIDRDVLADALAILAAFYRHLHDDFGQLEFWPRFPMEVRYQVEWNEWFTATLEELVGMPDFVRNVVDAVVFASSPYGETARYQWCLLLTTFCGMEDWGDPNGYVRQYRELPGNPVRQPKKSPD